MENKQMKRGSPSSVMRAMEIKTTMKYYYIPIRGETKEIQQRLWRMQNDQNSNCWWEHTMTPQFGKISWQILIKLVIYNVFRKTTDKHTTQMNLKCIMLYQISQPQKAAYFMIYMALWKRHNYRKRKCINDYAGLRVRGV